MGSHPRSVLTTASRLMYGPAGHAYVYFTYGMHWMLNFVTEEQGFAAATLVRAIIPTEGLEVIAARRDGQPPARWTDGPAKLCRALGIDGRLNGTDLCAPDAQLFVEAGEQVPEEAVARTPRVGLFTVPEPWKSIAWRFVIVR